MSVKDMLLLQKSKDMVDSTDEKRLLAELGAGSFQAFEKLYHRYSGKLYNFIMRISAGNRYMAEEVVQSTYMGGTRNSRPGIIIHIFPLHHCQESADEYVPKADCRVCL